MDRHFGVHPDTGSHWGDVIRTGHRPRGYWRLSSKPLRGTGWNFSVLDFVPYLPAGYGKSENLSYHHRADFPALPIELLPLSVRQFGRAAFRLDWRGDFTCLFRGIVFADERRGPLAVYLRYLYGNSIRDFFLHGFYCLCTLTGKNKNRAALVWNGGGFLLPDSV